MCSYDEVYGTFKIPKIDIDRIVPMLDTYKTIYFDFFVNKENFCGFLEDNEFYKKPNIKGNCYLLYVVFDKGIPQKFTYIGKFLGYVEVFGRDIRTLIKLYGSDKKVWEI